MQKIKVLPTAVANQIAAGEVVERPASVVKELVENSLDAGALRIEVDIEAAGRRLIQVSDDGDGMGAEDLSLSVQRHATSKIREAGDLWSIHTFGFRGEALPSIASVSRFSLTSREKGSAVAHRLEVRGGEPLPLEEEALPRGSRVTVRDLFFNTPARLKFLKAPSTETSRIQQVLVSLALANPAASFRLRADGRVTLEFFPAASSSERIGQVLGASRMEQALEVSHVRSGLALRGWVVRPHLHRGNRGGQHLFVNGRPVEHRLLNLVLSQAFGALIPHGRFASAVLFLTLPADFLDVNVHPAKREVRFGDEQALLSLIRQGVSQALEKASLVVEADLSRSATAWQFSVSAASGAALPAYPAYPAPSTMLEGTGVHEMSAGTAPRGVASSFSAGAAPGAGAGWPAPLAQLHRSYLLCQSETGLVLVDQHAAHERVLYEAAMKRLASAQTETQGLLLPQKFELGAHPASKLREWLPALQGMGLEISDMGAGLFYVVSVPAFLKGVQIPPLMEDLLESVSETLDPDPVGPFRREIAAQMACRAAIKAGDPMNLEEMHALVRSLAACEMPWSCPHGRPPMVSISLVELEKYFQRR